MPCPNPTHRLFFPPPLAQLACRAGSRRMLDDQSLLACFLAPLPASQNSNAPSPYWKRGTWDWSTVGKLLKWRWRWRWKWDGDGDGKRVRDIEMLMKVRGGGKRWSKSTSSLSFEVILLQGRSSSRHRGSRGSTVSNQVRLQSLPVIHLVLHLGHLPPPQLTSNATTKEQQQQQQPYHSQHHPQHNLPCVGFLPRWR